MFDTFAEAVNEQFNKMSEGELFVVDAPVIYEQYLAAFPPGTNPNHKQRTEHDCQTCKRFIKNLGRIVTVKNGRYTTVWGVNVPYPYDIVADCLDSYVKCNKITGIFRTIDQQFGNTHNYDRNNQKFTHLFGRVANKHRCMNAFLQIAGAESDVQVFRRGLEELSVEAITTVLDLIKSNSLYRGDEHLRAVESFKQLKSDYLVATDQHTFVWEHYKDHGARFRNTVIGTLVTDLSAGVDLEIAVKSFETKVAPSNYKRPTSVITQRMVEQAVETINNLGLAGALNRRYAKMSDVSVNDVLFVGNNVKLKDNIVNLLEPEVRTSFDKVGAIPVTIDQFISDVLPSAKSVAAYVDSRHVGNFVSLTGGDGPERLFKWNNNFAWSYDGDVTDSIKQRVKNAGGNVDALLRISLSWFNTDDLDLHAYCPREHIYYGNKRGILDVDMNVVATTTTPVENLAFTSLMDGDYKIAVNQFRRRNSTDVGFELEFEYMGLVRRFKYETTVTDMVDCFTFNVKGNTLQFTNLWLEVGTASIEKWGIRTESLVPVSAIMLSPNHWSGQQIGQRHVIFALEGCKNPDKTRGIYNEYLRNEFEIHRKVFEVLGDKTKCPVSDDQISGLGFTKARGDFVTVQVDGRKKYHILF